jgi:hypothetical protein
MDEQNTGVAAAAEPRTREIRAEIEQTREDMSETVNAIQERLRPGNIAANAADSVRHAARERVRDVADSDSVQYVRANPIPTAMVGIGVAGLVWLAVGANDSQRRERVRYRRGFQDWGSRFDPERERDYAAGRNYGDYGTAAGYTPGLSYAERDTHYPETPAGTGWGAASGSSSSSMSSAADQVTASARNAASRAQYTARRTWDTNPLFVGAASAVLGAVIGLAVPETERENELMGETRDNLVDTVQETVKDRVGKVQEAATNAMSNVQEAAKDAVGISGDRTNEPGSMPRG